MLWPLLVKHGLDAANPDYWPRKNLVAAIRRQHGGKPPPPPEPEPEDPLYAAIVDAWWKMSPRTQQEVLHVFLGRLKAPPVASCWKELNDAEQNMIARLAAPYLHGQTGAGAGQREKQENGTPTQEEKRK